MKKRALFMSVCAIIFAIISCSDPNSGTPAVIERTISFDANGGVGAMEAVKVADGAGYSIPAPQFSREGYAFASWNAKADGTGQSYALGSTIPNVTADTRLFAIWLQNPWIITFDANGGSGGEMAAGMAENGGNYAIPATCGYTKGKYVFSRWNTQSDGKGADYAPGGTINNVTAHVTLFAIWIAPVIATFYANDGSGAATTAEVAFGSNYTVPACEFTRGSFTFSHWNSKFDDSGQSYFQGFVIQNVTANMAFYATWSANPRTVAFAPGDGTGTMPSQQVEQGSQYTIPACTFTYVNHTFTHWTDGSATRNVGDKITINGNVTLTASWAENPIVQFYAGDGEGRMESVRVPYNTSYEIPACGFSYVDHHFLSWRDEGGTSYSPGARITLTSNLILTAWWAENWRVSFNKNGGTGTMADQHAAADGSYTIPACSFTFADNSFRYWQHGAATRKPGDVVTLNANTTLTAVWGENPLVTFHANGGSGSMAGVRVVYGGNYAVPTCDFTRDTYVFTGWNTQADGKGTSYRAGIDTIPNMTSGITLYATWSANPRTVTFAPGEGGSGTMEPLLVDYNSEYTIPACAFTRENYTCNHWIDGHGVTRNVGSKIMVTENITLTADWTENWRVTFDAADGTGTMLVGHAASDGSYIVPACGFSYDGYTFQHWQYGGHTCSPGNTIMLEANTTLTAVWNENWRVSFNNGGGSGTMPVGHAATDGSYTVPACGFTYANYHFVHWHDAGGADLNPGDHRTLASNLVLTAVWVGDPRTVTFNAGDGSGSMNPQQAAYGSEFIVPACTFTYENYHFRQWRGEGGSYYNQGDHFPVAVNTVLTAEWTENWRVTLDAGEGSGSPIVQHARADNSYTVPDCGFTRTGYTFTNWVQGTTPCIPGNTITLEANTTLTAVWNENWRVTFDAAGGGTGSIPTNEHAATDGSYTVPPFSMTRPGYTFQHWQYGENTCIPGNTIRLTANTTLTAVWDPNHMTVTFESGGGDSGTMDPQGVDYGSEYALPACGFGRTNFYFVDWLDNGIHRAVGSTIPIRGNVTLTASWAENPIVHFDANGGRTGSMDDVHVAYGSNYTVPACGFTHDTLVFYGWNTEANGSGQTYRPGIIGSDTISDVRAGITLYATWVTNAIKFMGFDDGLQPGDYFDGDTGVLSIETPPVTRTGMALKRSLTVLHECTAMINGSAAYQDFWLRYDFLLYYANGTGDTFPADSMVPMVLLYDSDAVDRTYIGTPLSNTGTEAGTLGLQTMYAATSVAELNVPTRVSIDSPIAISAGEWHTIKVHVDTVGTTAGVEIYIDGVLQNGGPYIAAGTEANAHLDQLGLWYHELGDPYQLFPAQNTVVFVDNLGVYLLDPDSPR